MNMKKKVRSVLAILLALAIVVMSVISAIPALWGGY